MTEASATDSLCLFDYVTYYVSSSPLIEKSYHPPYLFTEQTNYVEGTPRPYTPQTDTTIGLMLLFCFFLTSVALARGKHFFGQQLQSFFNQRERGSLFDTSTASEVRYFLVLVFQTCLLGGIGFFAYSQYREPLLADYIPSGWLIGAYTLIGLSYYIAKWLFYRFLGWVFFDPMRTGLWLEAYLTLIYYLGFILFPYILVSLYYPLPPAVSIVTGLSILVVWQSLLFYKWIKLFSNQITDILLLFLYFCALEIIPCLLAYQALVEVNHLFLINF